MHSPDLYPTTSQLLRKAGREIVGLWAMFALVGASCYALAGCGDDGGETTVEERPLAHGEPCDDPYSEESKCGVGLSCISAPCGLGYCGQTCNDDDDCEQLGGLGTFCAFGECHIRCNEKEDCPTDIGTTLICVGHCAADPAVYCGQGTLTE
jgi:hypothetical protein